LCLDDGSLVALACAVVLQSYGGTISGSHVDGVALTIDLLWFRCPTKILVPLACSRVTCYGLEGPLSVLSQTAILDLSRQGAGSSTTSTS
jgi:hypothetical protein